MRLEPPEQFGQSNLFADPAAHAGGIVKDQPCGNAADVFKDILQALADALRRFTAEDLGQAAVAMREGNAKIFVRNSSL